MPARHGHLRGQYHTLSLVALFANLPEIPTFWFGERRHRPVVDHQHVYAADPGKEMAETSFTASPDGSIRAVGLSVGDHLLPDLSAERQAHADVEWSVNQSVKRGIAGIHRHAHQG